MSHALTPQGMFYCKGCAKHRPLAERLGKYGKHCKHCAPKETKNAK